MDNLARREYDQDADKKVKEELQIAGIPVVRVGLINNEVKTYYIGILNGFVFIRAWRYWVVKGNMPLENAQYLYDNYKDLNIRVAGHCGNPSPDEWAKNKDYDKLMKPYVNKLINEQITMEELENISKDIASQGERFVDVYHIDTQLGLCKFVEVIKNNNIQSDIIED